MQLAGEQYHLPPWVQEVTQLAGEQHRLSSWVQEVTELAGVLWIGAALAEE
jgi:hypothetical protein